MPVLNNVPADEVGQIVQSFVDEGKEEVTAEETSPGEWKITAND